MLQHELYVILSPEVDASEMYKYLSLMGKISDGTTLEASGQITEPMMERLILGFVIQIGGVLEMFFLSAMERSHSEVGQTG